MMTEHQETIKIEFSPPQINPSHLHHTVEEPRAQQRLFQAVVGGGAAALLGASVWAAITVATQFQIGWMAVALGLVVGLTVRSLGKGIDKIFGIVGSVWALTACGLGNLLAVCGVLSVEESVPLLTILSALNLDIIGQLMAVTFSPIDLLFYGIAMYEGYRLSFRQLEDPVATD